jgi:hypothetical protein
MSLEIPDFGWALFHLRNGERVARRSWEGALQSVALQRGYPAGVPLNKQTAEATGIPEGTVVVFEPYFVLCNTLGHLSVWVPSITDCLALDWFVVSTPPIEDLEPLGPVPSLPTSTPFPTSTTGVQNA